MAKLVVDLADPTNPIGRVREIEINFTAIYKGEDAWNANVMVRKLEQVLNTQGFRVGTYKLAHSWDAEHNEITEDEMRDYIYRKHGHTGKCSKCPDPMKWAEVERLRRIEFYKNKEVWDDPKRGRPPKGYNWATGEVERKKVVYILETQDERNKRLAAERKLRGKQRKKIEKPFTVWDDQEAGTNPEIEPTLQFDTPKRPTKENT